MSPPSSNRAPRPDAPAAPCPWAHVVRGESEAAFAAAPSSPSAAAVVVNSELCDRDIAGPSAESSENNGNGNGKKPAWSRPSNGVIEVGPVMGAVSWPALGESTRSAPKVSPSDSIKASEGSSSSSVAVGVPQPPAPVVANHQMKANSNNPNPNYPNSSRQKPMRRGSGGGANSNNHGLHLQPNGGPISPQVPPAPADMSHHIMPDKPTGQGQEPSPRDMHNSRNNSNWDHGSSSRGSGFSPHSHGGPDHHRPFTRRNNNNGGSGGGPHNGGGRRDSDRGGYSNHTTDWNKNPSSRHMPPQQPRGHHPRPFIRQPPPPPPAAAQPFIAPPPIRSFMVPPMGFPEIPPPFFYVQGPPPPFVAAHPVAHTMPPPILVPELQHNSVLKQIEYYFSNDNLCKDMYLRRHMDEQGWVPVALIAGFNRVRQLTNNIPNSINYILDLVRSSELVEVQGENIRRRGDWMIWVLLPSQPSPHGSTSSPRSPSAPNVDSMVDHMQSMVLEEKNNNHSSGGATVTEVFRRTASGNFINQSEVEGSNDNRHGRPAGNAASDQ